MTVIVQNDHLTAGTWAACVSFVTIVYLIVLIIMKIFHLLTWKPVERVSQTSHLKGHRVTSCEM